MSSTTVIVIDAPHFCAAVETLHQTGTVYDCAPILKYMRGWTPKQVEDYCKSKGWTYDYRGKRDS